MTADISSHYDMEKLRQMDNLVRSSICSFSFSATVLKSKMTWEKKELY